MKVDKICIGYSVKIAAFKVTIKPKILSIYSMIFKFEGLMAVLVNTVINHTLLEEIYLFRDLFCVKAYFEVS